MIEMLKNIESTEVFNIVIPAKAGIHFLSIFSLCPLWQENKKIGVIFP